MPIVDGVYVAPTWVNNGPPAIDETEMQAICDTVAQTGNVTTPAQTLGLTGDLSIGASLGVLATVGDLHVWRRTQTIPGTYELGDIQEENVAITDEDNQVTTVKIFYSDSVFVSNEGVIDLGNPQSEININGNFIPSDLQMFVGKFIKTSSGSVGLNKNEIYYLPDTCEIKRTSNSSGVYYLYITQYQLLTVVPPGTYTDYPVSTNPNAYQAGSDAQPAGYTLGAVQSGSFKFTTTSGNYIIAGDGVNVSQDGVVSLSNNTIYTKQSTYTGDNGAQTLQSAVAGKFFYLQNSESEEFNTKEIYYVPSNATVTWNSSSGGFTELSKYQPVTGYPAIPAGTTIEYLGKLGDKTRIVTGSYVGTGTYGVSNPNTLEFDSPPKILFISPASTSVGSLCIITPLGQFSPVIDAFNSTSSFGRIVGVSSSFSGNSVSWYNTGGASNQLNSNGFTFAYKAIL